LVEDRSRRPPWARSVRGLLNVISGEKTVDQILTARAKTPRAGRTCFGTRSFPDCPASWRFTRLAAGGMAFRFSRLLSGHGWNIVSARVGQMGWAGARGVLITDSQGAGLTPERVRT